MNKQPESLRLADGLEKIYGLKAEAAELRRLHEVNAELVEALDCLMRWQVKNVHVWNNSAYDNAHLAIAKATGEQQ